MTDLTTLTVDELHAQLRGLTGDKVKPITTELVRRARIPNLLRTSGVPRTWAGVSLGEVAPQPGQQTAARALLRVAPGAKGLYLYGQAGHGKSYLSAAWVTWLVMRGISAKYIRWADLLADVRERMDRRDKPEPAMIDLAIGAEALVLDDLGAGGRATPWSVGIAERILDDRLGEGRVTVITSNLAPAGPPSIPTVAGTMSARVASRLAEACAPLKLSGRDLRVHGVGG